MQQEFLSQREFIASQFREVEKKWDERFTQGFKQVDGRFEQLEKKMDERFEQVDERFKQVDERFKQVDERFKQVDERFDKVDCRFDDIKVQLENAAAITRNGRLRRMHQPINLIKVLKPAGDPNNFIWTSHPQVPKHMKNTYILGQQAKGVFGPSWEGKSNQQSMYLMARCFIWNVFENL